MFEPSATGHEQSGPENVVYPEIRTTVVMAVVRPMPDSLIQKVKYLISNLLFNISIEISV